VDQTPAHDGHNPDLLKLMNRAYATVVEIGCSRGSLARAYRQLFSQPYYVGVDIDPENADAAREHCDSVISGDIENLDAEQWESLFPSDCWVFGDSLEHLRDPWALLRKVRQSIRDPGEILACIPNAQHWSVQARLASGSFFYEDAGLLDRTHLRWFTRTTIIDLFESTGFSIREMFPRIFDEPMKSRFLPSIASLAAAAGSDQETALRDSLPLQYVLRAVPK
jgi:SAM-dependent methyltransferase